MVDEKDLAPAPLAENLNDAGTRQVDEFGDGIANLVGKRIGRGATNRVTAAIIYEEPPINKVFVRVSVESTIKKGHIIEGRVPFEGKSPIELAREVNLLGGSLAEILIEKYNDVIDPSECAKAASEAWDDVKKAFLAAPTVGGPKPKLILPGLGGGSVRGLVALDKLKKITPTI